MLNTNSGHCSILSKGAVSYREMRCLVLLFMVLSADCHFLYVQWHGRFKFYFWSIECLFICSLHCEKLPFPATLPSLPLLALSNCFGNLYCSGSTTTPKSLRETTASTTSNSYSGIAGFNNGTLIPEPDAHFCLSTFKSPRRKTSSAMFATLSASKINGPMVLRPAPPRSPNFTLNHALPNLNLHPRVRNEPCTVLSYIFTLQCW